MGPTRGTPSERRGATIAGVILLAEANPELRRALGASLRAEGWTVDCVGSAQDALSQWKSAGPDLFLLDADLVSKGTPRLLGQLRDDGWAGDLVLMGRPPQDTAAIDDLGVDDSVTKPVVVQDLLGRIRARLVRTRTSSRVLRLMACTVDLDRQVVHAEGAIRRLTTKEADFLGYLSDNSGRTVTRDELLKHWRPSSAPNA